MKKILSVGAATILFLVIIFHQIGFSLGEDLQIPGQSCLHPLQAMLNEDCGAYSERANEITFSLGELKFDDQRVKLGMKLTKQGFALKIIFENFPDLREFFRNVINSPFGLNCYSQDVQVFESTFDTYPDFLPKFIYTIKKYPTEAEISECVPQNRQGEMP